MGMTEIEQFLNRVARHQANGAAGELERVDESSIVSRMSSRNRLPIGV